MAVRPRHTEDKTAWEIHTREARHTRLRSLADSVNDTARTARNSLSLLLIVALYLGLTLVASTDENLLRNGQVVLPQVGVGLSVVQSYIFAPLIFLYLHAQLLFLLTVLAWKVRTFEVVLKEEFPDTAPPNIQEKVKAKREECRDWLSAFAFVQLFRLPSGVPHVSKVLTWSGIEAVPLILLFVLDLSFIRYQSGLITWEHHAIFVIDLVFLAWFNWRVFGRGFLGLWTLKRMVKRLRRLKASAPEHSPRPERRILGRTMTAAWEALAFSVALLLIFAAHPPNFTPEAVKEDRESIWGKNEGFWGAVWNCKNPLDAGPCKWWGLACRYLDVSNKRLVDAQGQDISGPKSDKLGDESFVTIDLAGRNLRFANFQHAQLWGTDLRNARLQGADLGKAQLQGTDFRNAWLQGADLQSARLQGAYLRRAQLQDADLRNAQLQGTDLGNARLQCADLRRAQLQGADLRRAQLQDADLRNAQLQGTDLGNARLQGTDLRRARLQSGSGKSDPWHLVWAFGASYDFSGGKSSCPKAPGTDEREDRKPGDPLPDNYSQPNWNAWAEWTAEFACEDKYTARSSLERWRSRDGSLSRLMNEDFDEAQELVREALATARTTKTEEECPGLHSISDDEWKRFVGS